MGREGGRWVGLEGADAATGRRLSRLVDRLYMSCVGYIFCVYVILCVFLSALDGEGGAGRAAASGLQASVNAAVCSVVFLDSSTHEFATRAYVRRRELPSLSATELHDVPKRILHFCYRPRHTHTSVHHCWAECEAHSCQLSFGAAGCHAHANGAWEAHKIHLLRTYHNARQLDMNTQGQHNGTHHLCKSAARERAMGQEAMVNKDGTDHSQDPDETVRLGCTSSKGHMGGPWWLPSVRQRPHGAPQAAAAPSPVCASDIQGNKRSWISTPRRRGGDLAFVLRMEVCFILRTHTVRRGELGEGRAGGGKGRRVRQAAVARLTPSTARGKRRGRRQHSAKRRGRPKRARQTYPLQTESGTAARDLPAVSRSQRGGREQPWPHADAATRHIATMTSHAYRRVRVPRSAAAVQIGRCAARPSDPIGLFDQTGRGHSPTDETKTMFGSGLVKTFDHFHASQKY